MTAFADLPLAEQKALWRSIAAAVLPRWQVQPQAIEWLGYSSNAVFKISAADAAYVLRLKRAPAALAPSLRSELHWLRAIRSGTKLLAPYPLAMDAGLLLQTQRPELPGPQLVYGALFEFIGGGPKPAVDLTAAVVYAIGGYLGQLHSQAQFQPPPAFERPVLDGAGLFGPASPYASPIEYEALGRGGRAIVAAVAAAARAALRHLEAQPATFGLIHADLLAKNILFQGERVAAIDFEYSGWGYFLYDLAPLLWQLKGERAADYVKLEAALWAGYTAARPVPAAQRALLEPFIAARQLAACRWLLAHLHHPTVRAQGPALLQQRLRELQGFLGEGRLRRQSATL